MRNKGILLSSGNLEPEVLRGPEVLSFLVDCVAVNWGQCVAQKVFTMNDNWVDNPHLHHLINEKEGS